MASKSKPACKYGATCYRKNPDHLRDFSHPPKNDDDEEKNDSSDSSNAATEDTREIESDKRKQTSSPDADKSLKRRKTDESEPPSNTETEESKDEDEEKDIEEEDPPASPDNVKENIKMKFLFEMPDDFYQFWEFCRSLNRSDPQGALKCLKLKLVGPFDILAGKHKTIKRNKSGRRPNFLLHHRYYFDPPEFQTVLVSEGKDSLHYGYFRDDPSENPVFVASNSPASDSSKEKITPCGDNLFAAVHIHATKAMKSCTPFEKVSIQKLMKSLEQMASNCDLDISSSSKAMKLRQKKVVCSSFHGAGIVVPVDENEIGYRPVPETPGDLKAIFKKISEAKSEKEKDRHMEELQELITLVQFANDECDYGEGLELGMDLFSYGGKVFHPQISLLLPLAYQLLNRPEFAQIITAHLARRRGVDECVDELAV